MKILSLFPTSPPLIQYLLKPDLLLYSLMKSLVRFKIYLDILKINFAVLELTLLNLC